MRKNKLIEMTLKQRLNHHLWYYCYVCGEKKIKVISENLPWEMKEHLKTANIESFFLYCEEC